MDCVHDKTRSHVKERITKVCHLTRKCWDSVDIRKTCNFMIIVFSQACDLVVINEDLKTALKIDLPVNE